MKGHFFLVRFDRKPLFLQLLGAAAQNFGQAIASFKHDLQTEFAFNCPCFESNVSTSFCTAHCVLCLGYGHAVPLKVSRRTSPVMPVDTLIALFNSHKMSYAGQAAHVGWLCRTSCFSAISCKASTAQLRFVARLVADQTENACLVAGHQTCLHSLCLHVALVIHRQAH